MSAKHTSLAMLLLAPLLLAAGCGSDSSNGAPPVEGPLPVGPDDAQAYTEIFLDDNPAALLQPDHLVVVTLEPTGSDDGDTCETRDGVDCLPYVVDHDMVLTLSAEGAPEELDEMVLRDASGAALLTVSGGGEPATAIVPAGEYVLELHHVFAGDANAAAPLVFLRPSDLGAGDDDVRSEPLADAGAGAQAPPTGRQLIASRECISCSFAGADLAFQNFDGATLNDSVFDGATLLQTTFRGATMLRCSLRELQVVSANLRSNIPFDGDFTGALMTGSWFSFVASQPQGFIGIFQAAILNNTRWEATNMDAQVCRPPSFPARCSAVSGDFRNADLRGSRFAAIRFEHNIFISPKFDCTFQGADLSGADFTPTAPVQAITTGCRFDRDPETGRRTNLRGANLSKLRVLPTGSGSGRGDFSDADLTGAILDGADFGSPYRENPGGGRGAILARAILTGASIVGTRFANADLSGAILSGVRPSFEGLDLRLANFADAVFASVDLSRTDLSTARSFRQRAPSLRDAKLSDGTVGVNLAGQAFPPGYDELKGADLTGADLTRTELLQANLEGATLNRIKAVGANFNFANLRGAKLRGAELGVEPGRERAAATMRGAFMPDVDLTDADLRSVNLAGAHLYGDTQRTLLIRTRLDSANLSKAICSGAHFSGSLNNAVFDGAQLVNAVFNGATLTNAKLDDAYLQGADFSAAVAVTGTVLSNSAVSAAPGNWSFTEQDGTPFTIRYEATKLGPLATDPSVRCPNGSFGPCCPDNDLASCLTQKLKPVGSGPFPPIPACVPRPPRYDNCITPLPTRTPRPTPTPR